MKKYMLILGLLFLISSNVYALPIQWIDNGHYYEYTNVGGVLFWDAAKAAAEAKGGYLATVTSVEEDDWIWDNIAQGQFLHAWLGGFQPPGSVEPDGGGSWVTGEPWDYTRWYVRNNEPNNFIGNDPNGESVLELGTFQYDPSDWKDLDTLKKNYTNDFIPGYITEWDSNPDSSVIPEPSSLLLVTSGLLGFLGRQRKKQAVF